MRLNVAEIFASLQGEGPTAGKPAVFLRLAGCNLDCGGTNADGSKWYCDSKKLWQHGVEYTLEDLRQKVDYERAVHSLHNIIDRIVITGGEPLLQSAALQAFIFENYANRFHVTIEVETNGTLVPPKYLITRVDQWNCSPKLLNSGMPRTKLNLVALQQFASLPTSVFKFVVNDERDVEEATNLLESVVPAGWLKSNKHRVFLMPAGATQQQLQETSPVVWDMCRSTGYTFSPRLQVFVYGTRTGV